MEIPDKLLKPGDPDETVRCELGKVIVYIPREIFTAVVFRAENFDRRYVTFEEGAVMFALSRRRFHDLAEEADAVRHFGRRAMVNIEKVDRFLDTCL